MTKRNVIPGRALRQQCRGSIVTAYRQPRLPAVLRRDRARVPFPHGAKARRSPGMTHGEAPSAGQRVDSVGKFPAIPTRAARIAEGNLRALFFPAKSRLPLRPNRNRCGDRWKERQTKPHASPAPPGTGHERGRGVAKYAKQRSSHRGQRESGNQVW